MTTEHNCVPRDMIAIGEQFIFGYNIHFGLRQTTHPNDVFAVYTFRDGTFHADTSDLLSDPQFERDFQEIYKYYKDAEFRKFFVIGPFLYMTFRVGKGANDYKSLKWKAEEVEGDEDEDEEYVNVLIEELPDPLPCDYAWSFQIQVLDKSW